MKQSTIPALIAVGLLAFAGCERGPADHGKASDGKPPQASHDGHAHGAVEPEAQGHVHGGHEDEVKLTPEAIRRNGIRVAQAKSQVLKGAILVPARVAYNAEQVAHISSTVTGRAVEIKARLGDTVAKGDVLMIVDSPELGEAQSDYLQKKAAVEVVRPAFDLAKEAYERAQKLFDQSQGISLTEVQSRKAEYLAAAGNIVAAEAATKAAINKLHLWGMDESAFQALVQLGQIHPAYAIRSPIAGQVIERETTLGERVSPDKERLMVIADLSTVWVLADVPESKLGEVAVGSSVQIQVSALGGQNFEGSVSYIAPELDPATRTARVRIEVKNPDMKLRPGMFAQAMIAIGVAGGEPVVTIAEEAVQTVEGEPAVFVPVESEPNTFAKRAVGVGGPIDGKVPVFAGLKDGEKYVASGSFILKAELGKAGAAHEH